MMTRTVRAIVLLGLLTTLLSWVPTTAYATTPNNLITNGTFDGSLSPWQLTGTTPGQPPVYITGSNPHVELVGNTNDQIYQDFTLPAGGNAASKMMMSFTIYQNIPGGPPAGWVPAYKPEVSLELASNSSSNYFIEDVSPDWGPAQNVATTYTFLVDRPNFPGQVGRLRFTAASCSGHIGTTLYSTGCTWSIDNVSLKAYPEISTVPSLSFDGLQGGANPASQTLAVNDSGAQGLTWTAATDKPWLALSGTTASSTTVSANTAGMAPGTYTGNVVISSANATNAPYSVPVTLVVHGPALAVTQTKLNFEGPVNGTNPPSQNLTISNAAGGTMAWTATADQPWVALSPASGSVGVLGSQTPTVAINTAGLAAGFYSANITVKAPGATNPSVTVPVSLEVRGPTLQALPPSMSFTGEVGGASPATQTATVSNTGGGKVNWTASSNQPWLTLSPASGTLGSVASSAVTVTANTTGLALGTYEGTITWSAPALGTTRTTPVRLYVVPKGDIILNGGFEGATSIAPWVASSGETSLPAGTGAVPHSGSRFLRVTGNGEVYQPVTIPKNATSADLSYALKITTAETTTTVQKDQLQVLVRDGSPGSCDIVDQCPILATLNTWSNLDAGTGYVVTGPISLLRFRARPLYIEFLATDTTPTRPTYFDLDDAYLTVGTQDPAKMALSPTSLTFTGVAGAASPAAQTMNVASVAGSTGISWTASASQPWVHLASTSGTLGIGAITPDSISVSTAGLAAGTYTATVTAQGTAYPSGPAVPSVSVPITLTVTPAPPPVVVPSPLQLSFAIPAGGASVTQPLNIGRSPAAAQTWTATSNQSWLTLSAASGSGTSVGVTANATGLAMGTYSGAITVTGSGITKPAVVPVTLQVSAAGTELLKNGGFEGATLSPWVSAAAVTSSSAARTGTKFMHVGGTVTLYQPVTLPKGTTTASLTYWLRVNSTLATSAATRDTLSVEIRNWSPTCSQVSSTCGQQVLKSAETVTDLARTASYQQHVPLDLSAFRGQTVLVQFTSNASNATTFDIDDVSLLYGTATTTALQVTPMAAPPATEDPGTLHFTATAGATASPTEIVRIANTGYPNNTIAWTATSDSPWLTVSPGNGNSPVSTATVAANPTGLAAGIYRGTITVAVAGAAGSPAKVPVVFQVASTGPELITNPGFETDTDPWAFTGNATWWPSGGTPHSGSANVTVGGTDNSTDSVWEKVTIPSTATAANLSFYLKTTTAETAQTAYDHLYVEVTDLTGKVLSTFATFSNLDASPYYGLKGSYSLLAYKGQTVRLQFRSVSDTSLPTTFSLDDLSLK